METTGFVSIQIMRRGAHSKRLWADSLAIAHREQTTIRSRATVALLRMLTDFLATLAPRWAEETVMIARRPEACDAA